MVALDVGAHHIALADHGIPKIRAKIRPILQQPLRMPVGIWLWPWVSRQLADTVLAPNGKSLRSLGGVDLAGRVGGEGVNGGLEVRQQPRGNLFGAGVWVTQQADLIKPSVQGNGEGLDDERAGSIDQHETLDAVARTNQLLRRLESDDAAS